MIAILRKNWFLLCLFSVILVGLRLGGMVTPQTVLHLLEEQPRALSGTWKLLPRLITALILFLMSFSLDTRRLAASLQSPAPVLWGSIVNCALIPLFAWPLMYLQTSNDLAIGLMIAAAVPCTMAAASVWTRAAGGNDAVSLMITLLTNGLCFAITPFWLQITVSPFLAVDTESIRLDPKMMALRLVIAVLIPTLLGQLMRLSVRLGEFATRHKPVLGNLAQIGILLLVLNGAWQGGAQLYQQEQRPSTGGIFVVWFCCLLIHALAMLIAQQGGRWFGFERDEQIALYFAGSQKTLPIGIYLATEATLFGNPDFLGPGLGLPFVVFPMLLFHTTQLFMDTFVANAVRKNKSATAI